jgi:threonyl-tRNA synthetase
MINITLPDGNVREYPSGVTAHEVALSISEGLARNVLSAMVNEEIWDSNRPITESSDVNLLTWKEEKGKETLWHSSAHLMAEAVQYFYPETKFAIGPPIENGFYYDIDLGGKTISDSDFKKIEDKMLELARLKNNFIRKEVSKKDAIAYFKEKGDEYKLELLEDLKDGEITFYTQGEFTDLCRGPHLANTSNIKAVKITSTAGAYWRGDENRPQLTRLYGITFPKAKELKEYLAMLEEAKKRDHRKLGKELGLFTFSQRVGQGLPLWLPKGAQLKERLENFLKDVQQKAGYLPVATPHIGNKELYVCSGHYDKYGEDSFQPIKTPAENEEFLLKPMNCPHHCEIYKASPKSYKELPIRYAEFGTVYRYEQSGELHGLTRVRGFTQDDAHIFCRPDQLNDEFEKVIELVQYVFKVFGFNDYVAQISLRDPENREKYIGSDENWKLAEDAIIKSVEKSGLKTVVEYGEAAFYGPKLDFMVKDAIGRKWQLGTIQVDYNLPERFELDYTGKDDQKHRPVMIHRAPFGSLERFCAILIEHVAGKFPLWLSPEQVAILPVSDKYNEAAKELLSFLNNSDIRGFIDERSERVSKKIRDTEVSKVPYMIILGEKEITTSSVSARKHGEGELERMTNQEFVEYINEEIKNDLKK